LAKEAKLEHGDLRKSESAYATSTAKEASKNMLFLSGRYFQQGILLYAQRDMAPSMRDSTRFA
jgi:hypothetical protein